MAAEKLRENHACLVSRETLRKWMIEDGLWKDRKHRLPPVHQPRHRRERVGELIQIDGSRHYWFENRGPECTLIAYIDGATSRIQHAAFVPSESTLDYGTHSMRRTKAAQICKKTGNLRAVQLLLGHTKLESTVRYLGIEVDDALSISEQVEL